MKIECPAENQIPLLRNLWKKAFGDDDAFLDIFFTTAFSPARCRCISENGGITATLYWFDVSCGGRKLAYLYAVATDPDHRGRGLCRSLMEDVRLLLAQAGYAGILLVPQSEALREMYRKMGYRDCTAVTERIVDSGSESIPCTVIDQQAFASLRRVYLPERGVVQEGENLRFLSAQAQFLQGADFLAAVTLDGQYLHCHELLGNTDSAAGILRALNCFRGFFRMPGGETPFAQYLPLRSDCPVPGYFGLAFD